jgi:ABC-type phosphate transport system permease subunit
LLIIILFRFGVAPFSLAVDEFALTWQKLILSRLWGLPTIVFGLVILVSCGIYSLVERSIRRPARAEVFSTPLFFNLR